MNQKLFALFSVFGKTCLPLLVYGALQLLSPATLIFYNILKGFTCTKGKKFKVNDLSSEYLQDLQTLSTGMHEKAAFSLPSL